MQRIARIESLPDRPTLTGNRYLPQVEQWQSVRWYLGGVAQEPQDHYLDLDASRPAVLLLGCSYVVGDYLPAPARLLGQLRERLPDVAFSSLAASGGGLLTNLAHVTKFLPMGYQPKAVLLAPSQSFRQYIPESTDQFNATPYSLWQQYYFVHSHSDDVRQCWQQELLARDLLRLRFLVDTAFPEAIFYFTLFDSEGTGEITLLTAQEREALEAFIASRADRCHVLIERTELVRLYLKLGPFDGHHPSLRQVNRWAEIAASRLHEIL